MPCEEQVKLGKRGGGTARAKTKGQEEVSCCPGARKLYGLENHLGNELDDEVGAEQGPMVQL